MNLWEEYEYFCIRLLKYLNTRTAVGLMRFKKKKKDNRIAFTNADSFTF